MRAANFVDRGRVSMTALAKKAGVSVETVRGAVWGMRKPEVETVNAIADALHRDRVEVAGWAEQKRTVRQPYTPPAEADLLNPKQRDALSQLIRSIVEGQGGPARTRAVEVADQDGLHIVRGVPREP